jgi:Flp pilus assembly protein TadB
MAIGFAILGVLVLLVSCFGPHFYRFSSDHTVGTMLIGGVAGLALIGKAIAAASCG